MEAETTTKSSRCRVGQRHVHQAYLRIILEGAEGAAYHGVRAEDGYGGCWWVVVKLHLWVGSSVERTRGTFLQMAERTGALCPDPLVGVARPTSLRYLMNLKFARCEVPSISFTSTWRQPEVHVFSVFQV